MANLFSFIKSWEVTKATHQQKTKQTKQVENVLHCILEKIKKGEELEMSDFNATNLQGAQPFTNVTMRYIYQYFLYKDSKKKYTNIFQYLKYEHIKKPNNLALQLALEDFEYEVSELDDIYKKNDCNQIKAIATIIKEVLSRKHP